MRFLRPRPRRGLAVRVARKAVREPVRPDTVNAVRRLVAEWSENLKTWERNSFYVPAFGPATPIPITPEWLARERAWLEETEWWLKVNEPETDTTLAMRRDANGGES